jgi:predicted nucleic acid-binding protein
MFTAFLDANALVPVSLTDTMLRCAEKELFRPLWSDRVIAEARRAVLRVRPDLSPARVGYRFAAMRSAFPEAEVRHYEHMIAEVTLPDRDDRHVVAAARLGGADIIVTRNLKDFPAERLQPFGLEAVDPDQFLCDMLDLAPQTMAAVIADQAGDA